MGVKAGVPDFLIFNPAPLAVGTAVELKRKGGRASPEQLAWLAALGRCGWHTKVCYGADDAVGFLSSLYPRGGRK
jgi:hypothetical protein